MAEASMLPATAWILRRREAAGVPVIDNTIPFWRRLARTASWIRWGGLTSE
jgi:hypothetical protein